MATDRNDDTRKTAPVQLGAVLKAIRKQLNISQLEAADAAEMDGTSISRFESGKQGLSLERFEALLRVYRLPLHELLMKAAGLDESTVAGGTAPVPVTEALSAATHDGWRQVTAVLSTKAFAGEEVLLCQCSFEEPSFDLIYRGAVKRGFTSEVAAKAAAQSFARSVLLDLAKTLGN